MNPFAFWKEALRISFPNSSFWEDRREGFALKSLSDLTRPPVTWCRVSRTFLRDIDIFLSNFRQTVTRHTPEKRNTPTRSWLGKLDWMFLIPDSFQGSMAKRVSGSSALTGGGTNVCIFTHWGA